MPDTYSVDGRHLAHHSALVARRWPSAHGAQQMEQRYDAVVAVIRDGLTVTEAAEKFGVQPTEHLSMDGPL